MLLDDLVIFWIEVSLVMMSSISDMAEMFIVWNEGEMFTYFIINLQQAKKMMGKSNTKIVKISHRAPPMNYAKQIFPYKK